MQYEVWKHEAKNGLYVEHEGYGFGYINRLSIKHLAIIKTQMTYLLS